MRRLSLLVALFSLLMVFSVVGYVIDGDSVVYEDDWARLRVTPHTARSPVLDFEQTFKVTNKKSVGGDLCVAYLFDEALSGGGVWLEKTGFRDVWVPDLQCSNESGGNGTIEVCVDLGHNTQVEYEYFDNINQYFTHDRIGGKEVYYSNTPLHFDGLESHTWKIRYSPISGSGKWDLKAWNTISGSCVNAYQNPSDRNFLTTLDPWYNVSYDSKYPINCTNMGGNLIYVNGSFGTTLGGYRQDISTVCYGDGMSVYFNNYSDYIIANDTSLIPYSVEGNNTGYDSDNVYNSDFACVYHMNNLTDVSGNNYDGSVENSSFASDCKFGGCREFDGTRFASMDVNLDNNFNNNDDFSILLWFYPDAFSTTTYLFNSYYATTPYVRLTIGDFGADSDSLVLNARSGDNKQYTVTSSIDLSINTWYMAVVTFDSSSKNMSLYLNKSHQGSSVDATSNGVFTDASAKYQVGRSFTYSVNRFDGKIDEVIFYNKTLSPSDIYKIYNNSLSIDGFGDLGNLELGNSAPVIVNINVTPSTVYGDLDATFHIYVSDENGDNVTSYYNVTFTNGSLITNGTGLNNFSVVVGSGNYSHFDVINISVTPCDTAPLCGTNWDNVSFTVDNYLPVIDNINYSPLTVYNFTDMTWYVWVSDGDLDIVTGFYNITLANGTSIGSGNGSNNFSVFLSSSLYDVDDVITFSVYLNDGFENGTIGSENVTILGLVTTTTTTTQDNTPIAVLILLPILFGFMLLWAGTIIDAREHPAIKLFFVLLAFTTFFVSLHFGLTAIVDLYDYTALENLVGSTTYWVALIFGVIVTYFLIYLFIKSVYISAMEKKESRWNY